MSTEYWATYSVRDHTAKNAFVADLMLYDRIVVPFPPDDKEAARWEGEGWDPKRLERLLNIIGKDRVRTVAWTSWRQDRWRERLQAAETAHAETRDSAFQATRTELAAGVPAHVTAVESLAAYPSLAELEKGVGIRASLGAGTHLPSGAVTAIVGQEFLVPGGEHRSHEELLREAVDLSSDSEVRRTRADLWRWQYDFVNPRTSLTDAEAVNTAVNQMRDLISEQHAAIRKGKVVTVSRYAFLVGTVTIAALTGGALPVALSPMAGFAAESFLSVGQFVAERLLEPTSGRDLRPAAMLADAQRHFGWR
jgi:hypothetical protein